ncbi:MAG: hypothetical protein AB8F74_00255 [Saprospiraceae bacterium]
MNPNFEKHIRKTLSNQEEYVDAEAIWQGVEPHVRPEKKRRKFFWWFFFGLAAGLVTAGLLWTSIGLDNENLNAEVSITEKQNTTPQNSKASISTIFHENEKNNNNTSTEVDSKRNAKEKQSLTRKKNVSENANSTKSISNSSATVSKKTKAPKNIKQTVNSPSGKTEVGEMTTSDPLQSGKTNLIQGEFPIEKEKEVVGEVVDKKAIRSSTLVDVAALSFEIPMKPISEDGELITPIQKQRKWHYAIGAYGGVGRVSDKLNANIESENPLYLAEREKTETQLESVSLGLSLTAKYKSHLSFRSGLEYHRIARRFNYEVNQIDSDRVPNTILSTYINNTTGDTFYETGTITNTSSNTFEKEVFNYFHRLDVPLMLGYTTNGKRFRFGLEAGVHVNALLYRKGKILLDNEQSPFYDLNNDESKWYRTNVGVTPVLQSSLSYRVGPRMEIHTSPYYRFNTTYSSSKSNVRERYSDFGVQLGLKYWLR